MSMTPAGLGVSEASCENGSESLVLTTREDNDPSAHS